MFGNVNWYFLLTHYSKRSPPLLHISTYLKMFRYLYWKTRQDILKIIIFAVQKLHTEWNISSLYFLIFFDYGLQRMKTQNSVSQKIRILHKINKKVYFKQKYQASENYVHFYALNTWLGLLLHELLHQCGVAWRRSVCGTAQV